MDISRSYINRRKFTEGKTQNELMKEIGFIGYKRIITVYMKESKNMNGIVGHNLVTKVNCLITNYSVSKIMDNDTLFNKTVYVCDVDFPAHLSYETIKNEMSEVIHSATIRPIYAFSVSHVEKNDGNFIDLGLSMVDLNLFGQSQFAITNFADNKCNYPRFKEIIYSNHYNPKYYTREHAEANKQLHESRSGLINDFIDNNTKIIYNNKGSESLDLFVNNVQKTGIYINNKIIMTSEMITDLFNKLLFTSMEKLEFIIDTTKDETGSIINITELKFYTKFCDDATDFYLQEIYNNIVETVYMYREKFKEDFYMVCRFDEQFIILDIHLFKSNKEIRVTKPIFKLYVDFSLDNEEISNELEFQGEYAKLDLIEQVYRTQSMGDDTNKMIMEAISMVDHCTQQVQLLMGESASRRQSMIEDRAWAEKEKYLLSHKQ